MSLSSKQLRNPNHVFVSLEVNGVNLTEKGKFTLLDFSVNKVVTNAAGGEWSVTLFDKDWETVESTVMSSKDMKAKFSYGYTNGIKSPTYEAVISNVSSTLSAQGSTVTVKGVGFGALPMTDRVATKSYPPMSIDEVVKSAIEEEGYEAGHIEPCVLDYDARTGENTRYQRTGETLFQFLNKLKDQAVCRIHNISGYEVFTDPPTVAGSAGRISFAPPSCIGAAERADAMREYYVYRDALGEVISFSPELDLTAIYGVGGGLIETSTIDKISKAPINKVYDPRTQTSEIQVDGKDSWLFLMQTGSRDISRELFIPSATEAEVVNRQIAMGYKARLVSGYHANMVIIGDPTVQALREARVIVFTNRSVKHYSSGVYQILGVTDQINNGVYTTSLELMKYSSSFGNEKIQRVK